jgi:hypothetical protein
MQRQARHLTRLVDDLLDLADQLRQDRARSGLITIQRFD